MVVRDALTMGPREHEDAVTPHTRPPADDDAEHVLVRTVECIDGQVEVELVCEPAFDYGRARRSGRCVDGDRHTADATGAGPDDAAADRPGARHRGRPRPRAATCSRRATGVYCALSWAEDLARPSDVDEAAARLDATARFWRALAGPRRASPTTASASRSQRSALAIKGLTYMPTGATVAALTTSLPETPGGERNWDYRYTWMRDSTFTLQALHYLKLDWEADEFMQFVADLEPNEDGGLQIMYGIDGRRDLTESTRDDLSGYAGARPVRVGNGAFDQRQNDVFGAVLDSILLHTRRSQRLPRRLWPIVQAQAECADRGVARARPGHLGGARRAAALRLVEADVLGRARPGAPSWPHIRGDAELGEQLERRPPTRSSADILAHGVDERRRAAPALRHRRARRLDAAGRDLRVPARRRRAAARHVLAIADELTEHGFVLRYRTDETDDGLSGKEGTFLICSFWLVSALAIIGEQQRARDLMERLLRVASPLGLYAEEFDADTGRHLGNFPQAFSHLALIEAAARIIVAERLAEL